MKETQLFGKLLPANIDIQEILKRIRHKYDLPEIEFGDKKIEDYLGQDIDFQAIL